MGLISRAFLAFLISRAFLVFLMKESKKRRRKQPGKLMVSFTTGQFARCTALNEPPGKYVQLSSFRNTSGSLGEQEILWEHEP